MKIVILANSDIGLYKFRKELLETICRENDVTIVLPEGEFISDLTDLGCQFVNFELNRRSVNPVSDAGLIVRYLWILKKLRPDVVLTYTIKPNVYGGVACQMLKIPYITNITGLGTAIENGGILRKIALTLYKIGIKNSSCVFFQNNNNKQFFADNRINCGNVRLIPGSGVNVSAYLYAEYPETENEFRFLFVGRIMKDKGIGELLEAINKLHREREDITLDIVGFCDEDYMDAIRAAENTKAVRYQGLQTDVTPFYRNCHCVVLPSYHEGMANVLLEGSSTGRPIVATNVPGCRETFDEGITGFGCNARDAGSLYMAMKKMTEVSEVDLEKMGKAAREK